MRSALLWLFLGVTFAQNIVVFIQDDDGEAVVDAVVRLKMAHQTCEARSDSHGCAFIACAFIPPVYLSIEHPLYPPLRDTLYSRLDTFFYRLPFRLYDLKEVFLTATIVPQRTFPYPTEVLSKQTMETMGAITAEEALKQLPQIQIQYDPILGSRITMLGNSGRQVKILLDGVPVEGRLDGQIDLAQLNIDPVEKIEVIYGPLSLQYGSDALGGTIHLITQKDTGLHARVNAFYESVGKVENSVTVGAGKRHAWSFTFNRLFFNGWSPQEPTWDLFQPIRADSQRVKLWKPRELYTTRLFYQWHGEVWNIQAQLWGSKDKIYNRGYPKPPFYTTALDDYYYTLRLQPWIKVRYKGNKQWYWEGTYSYHFYERRKYTVVKDLTDLSEVPVSDPSLQDTTRFQTQLVRLWVQKSARFLGGVEWSRQQGLGKRLLGVQAMDELSGFLQYTFKWRSWQWTPALRWGYNTQFPLPLIPALSLQWQKGRWKWYTGYAAGFRAPSFKERYLYFVDVNHNIQGNPNLQAEKSHYWQTLVQYRRPFYNAEAFLFYNVVYNLITLVLIDPTTNLFTYANIGVWQSKGVRLSSQFQKGIFGSSVFVAFTDQNTPFYRSQLWELTGRVQVKWKERWFAALYVHYFGRSPYLIYEGETLVSRYQSPYALADFSVSRRFVFHKHTLRWVIGIKNLFNVRQVAPIVSAGVHAAQQYLSYGRSYFVRCQYVF